MSFDPAPLFAASLIPYLLFLYWLRKSGELPLMAERARRPRHWLIIWEFR